MTATVKRGAGRPAATAKRSRHAQQTPLPPKSDPVTDIRLEDSKSWVKAKQFISAVSPHGWSTSTNYAEGTETPDDIVELTAKRSDETLWISWTKGRLTTEPMPSYTIVDRTVKLRNASEAVKFASRPVEAAKAELSRVTSNKAFRPRERTPKVSALPFDPALATNEDVIEAIVGRSVVWHNRHSQVSDDAIVGPDRKRIEIVDVEGGDRIIKIVSSQTGFRAFRLSALERIGGGLSERRSSGRVVRTERKAKK